MIVFDEDFILLDIHEAAAELEVPVPRLQGWIRADRLAAVFHGGRAMIAQDEVERFRRDWSPEPVGSPRMRARRFTPPPRRSQAS